MTILAYELHRHDHMNIAEIMSSPATSVEPGTSIDEVIRLMDELGVRHLPVVEDGRLVGLISDRDVLESTGWLPDRLRVPFLDRPGAPRTAADIARSPVMSARPDDSVMTLSVEAVVQGVGALPVVDHGKVVGVVTELDLMRTFRHRCLRTPDGAHLDSTVERHMTRSVRAIDHRATLGEALRTMREMNVRHLPVVQAGHLVGVVSDRDLRRELGRGRHPDYPLTEVMTAAPATASPTTRLSEAIGSMIDKHISSLPVLRDEELVGILTALDVLEHCMSHLGDAA